MERQLCLVLMLSTFCGSCNLMWMWAIALHHFWVLQSFNKLLEVDFSEKTEGFSYLELHHRVLAEFVPPGSSNLIQANDLGLVADAIAPKTPDESRLAAILPCRRTQTDTQNSSPSSSQGPPSTSDRIYYLRPLNHRHQKDLIVTLEKQKQPHAGQRY